MRPCLSQPTYFAFFEVCLTKVANHHACIFDVVQNCAVGNLPEAVYSTPRQYQACVHVPHDSNSIHHRKISYLTFLCEYHVSDSAYHQRFCALKHVNCQMFSHRRPTNGHGSQGCADYRSFPCPCASPLRAPPQPVRRCEAPSLFL